MTLRTSPVKLLMYNKVVIEMFSLNVSASAEMSMCNGTGTTRRQSLRRASACWEAC
jgi:hypothetical protein